MRDENVEEPAVMSDVGIKSRMDDLGCNEERSCETSVGVTGETVEKSSPELDQVVVAAGGVCQFYISWQF